MATNPQVATGYDSDSSGDLPTPDIHDYDRSDAETRRKLFIKLLEERGHLVKLPAADRRLPQCGRFQSPSDTSDDPYDVRERFLEKWTNADPDSPGNSTGPFAGAATDRVNWDNYSVYTTPGTPGFVTSDDHSWNPPDGGKRVAMSRLISSQLLLYRLIATFGMPRPDDVNNMLDGYKSIWSYTLYWKSDQESQDQGNGSGRRRKIWFNISDYKGTFSVHFCGPSEASRSALDLLEWLVSDNVPHTYDGVLAGNIA